MFIEIFHLELTRRLKKISTWLYILLFSFLSYVMIWSSLAGGGIMLRYTKAGTGLLNSNAPYALHVMFTGVIALSCLVAVALFGTAATRDFRENTHELLFSHPLGKTQYILGRFVAALIPWLLIIMGVILAALLACLIPPTHPEKLGTVAFSHFLLPFFTSLLPLILRSGLLYFGCALLYRHASAATMILLVQFTCYMAALSLLTTRALTLAQLLDPFGILAARSQYAVWTLDQKNTLTIGMNQTMVTNHLFWGIIGIVVFGIAWKRFTFQSKTIRSRDVSQDSVQTLEPIPIPLGKLPNSTLIVGTERFYQVKQILHMAWTTFLAITRRIPFVTVSVAGVLFMLLVGARNIGLAYDTQSLPQTSLVLDLTQQLFMLFIFIITAWLAAELVWREKQYRVHEITGSAAVSQPVLVLGKLGALILVQTLLMALILITGIIIQMVHGYTQFELSLYFLELFILRLPIFIQLGIMAFLLHTLARNKLIGHLLVAAFYILQDFISEWGFEHHLWNYAEFLNQTHSSMNGFGPYIGRTLLFSSYWSSLALVFIAVIVVLLPRELDSGWRSVIKTARQRFTPAIRTYVVVACSLALFSGANAWYQTIQRHGYETSDTKRDRKVEYETRFKAMETQPYPQVTGLYMEVDLYPSQRRVECSGTMMLAVKTQNAGIQRIMIDFPDDSTVDKYSIQPPPDTATPYPEHNVVELSYTKPLPAGTTLTLNYTIYLSVNGVANSISDLDRHLIENGTFLNNQFLVPTIGYNREKELKVASRRVEYNLPDRPEFPISDISDGRQSMVFSPNAGFIDYEAVISTESDQYALTAGQLIKQWNQDNRRFYHYKMPVKSLLYYPVVSARYVVATSEWNGLPVEIYYHPGHEINVDTMLDAAVSTLEYCSANYMAYPYGVLRMVEYPRYTVTAESFPTLIPISEGIGFIARKAPGKVNPIARLVAHEVGHQWFPHLVGCANMPGMFFLTETMAQHVALMVMKQKHSPVEIRDYLDRQIQDYFQMRTQFAKREKPLSKTDYAYHVAYRKGMISMHALSKYLGKDTVEGAIKNYFNQFAYSESDYSMSTDLIQMITHNSSDDHGPFITELLESVSWYDVKIQRIQTEMSANGSRMLTVDVSGVCYQTQDDGKLRTQPMIVPVDIEIQDQDGRPVYRKTLVLDKFETTVQLSDISGLPATGSVIVDPERYLLDVDRVNNSQEF